MTENKRLLPPVTTPTTVATRALADISSFSRLNPRPLRPYQAECARAIAHSVRAGQGKTFTVMFARQMGKNETSAQLEAYLMALYARRGGTIVKAAPSFKPQIVNSILRLKETLDHSPLTKSRWKPAFGYMLQLGKSSVTFLSAGPYACRPRYICYFSGHMLAHDSPGGQLEVMAGAQIQRIEHVPRTPGPRERDKPIEHDLVGNSCSSRAIFVDPEDRDINHTGAQSHCLRKPLRVNRRVGLWEGGYVLSVAVVFFPFGREEQDEIGEGTVPRIP